MHSWGGEKEVVARSYPVVRLGTVKREGKTTNVLILLRLQVLANMLFHNALLPNSQVWVCHALNERWKWTRFSNSSQVTTYHMAKPRILQLTKSLVDLRPIFDTFQQPVMLQFSFKSRPIQELIRSKQKVHCVTFTTKYFKTEHFKMPKKTDNYIAYLASC
jgi:hypothetical protein